MMHIFRGLASLVLCGWAAVMGGCATMTDGTTQELSFQSNPEDVTVTATRRIRDSSTEYMWKDETRVLGKTPFTLQMDREENQTVVFSKDGYKPLKMKLATTTNANFWGNIALGGFFGSTTDSMTGAMYEYSPSQYFVTLIPEAAVSTESATLGTERMKAKEFIVRRHASLLADLSKNGGDDLSALMGLLHVQTGQEADARRKIRALLEVYTDAPLFADRLTELYLK